jgi:hypothetical protein
VDGYARPYTVDDLNALLIRKWFPERTPRESTIIRDFLVAHGHEFDKFYFSVRVGQGLSPDPAHEPGVQWNTTYSTRKRVDLLLFQGTRATIGEVKERISPAVLGQLRTYRQLYLEDHPGAEEPRLIAVGRVSDDDTLRVLAAEGIDVYLYASADSGG